MKARMLVDLVRDGKLELALRAQVLAKPFYRLCFLAGGLRHGALARLAGEAVPFETLVAEAAPGPGGRDALESWLRVGCLLGDLDREGDRYRLRSRLARALVREANDPVAALVIEAATLHWKLLLEGPGRLERGERFTLADQDGGLIARSSRILEPAVAEAVRGVVPPSGEVRLLEVGCGSGIYLRKAAEANPRLEALGLELQPDVAEVARENLRRWGVGDRVRVEVGDVRDREPDPGATFDLATLHNNIYYFPVEERVGTFRRVRALLRPGGTLLVTTATAGGSAMGEMLNLWAASTEGCGRLPGRDELVVQLREAGFKPDPPRSFLPGEPYFAFVARVPAGEGGADRRRR